jgi:hypothetical protein
LGEDFPESESFIGCGRCNGGAIGTESEMEDSARVTFEVSDSFHARVLPDSELVVDKSM